MRPVWVIFLLACRNDAFAPLQRITTSNRFGGAGPVLEGNQRQSLPNLSSTIVSIEPRPGEEEGEKRKEFLQAKRRLLELASGHVVIVDKAAQKEFTTTIRVLEKAADISTAARKELGTQVMSKDWTLLCSTASPGIDTTQLSTLLPVPARGPLKKLRSNLLVALDKYVVVHQKISNDGDQLDHMLELQHPNRLKDVFPSLPAGNMRINPLAIQKFSLTLSYRTTSNGGTLNLRCETISWSIEGSCPSWNSRDNKRTGSIPVASIVSPTFPLEPVFVDNDILVVRGSVGNQMHLLSRSDKNVTLSTSDDEREVTNDEPVGANVEQMALAFCSEQEMEDDTHDANSTLFGVQNETATLDIPLEVSSGEEETHTNGTHVSKNKGNQSLREFLVEEGELIKNAFLRKKHNETSSNLSSSDANFEEAGTGGSEESNVEPVDGTMNAESVSTAVLPALVLAGSFLGFEALVGEYGFAIAAVGMVGAVGASLAKDAFGSDTESYDVSIEEQNDAAPHSDRRTPTAIDDMIPLNLQLDNIFEMTYNLEEVESSVVELEEEIANALAFECDKTLDSNNLEGAPVESEGIAGGAGDSVSSVSKLEEELQIEGARGLDDGPTLPSTSTWPEKLSQREQEVQEQPAKQQAQIKRLEESVTDSLFFANDTNKSASYNSIPETVEEGEADEQATSSGNSSTYFSVNWFNDLIQKTSELIPGSRLDTMEKDFQTSIQELEEEIAEALRLAEDALREMAAEEVAQDRNDKNSTITGPNH